MTLRNSTIRVNLQAITFPPQQKPAYKNICEPYFYDLIMSIGKKVVVQPNNKLCFTFRSFGPCF